MSVKNKLMKNRLIKPRLAATFAGLALSALLLVAPAFAAGKQDFTLHNTTGKEVTELYISPHDEQSWEEDILGEGTLSDEDSTAVEFERDEEPDAWDLKVVFANGSSSVWSKLILTDITDVTLYYKDGKPFAKLELVEAQ